MDWHELEKMKVDALREMAKEKTSLEGVTGLHKDQLVEELAKALGIPKPHKIVQSAEKTTIKAQIRELKGKTAAALERKDYPMAAAHRRNVHGLKRKLRRMAKVVK